jgi:hypothetical protein
MSFLGGILKSVINPATLMQLAMGPAGWASLAVKTIGMAIGQQIIQQLGEKLGLPQSVISMAQSAFSAAAGQPGAAVQTVGQAVRELTEQFDLSPMQAGQLERAANDDVAAAIEKYISDSSEGEDAKNAKAGGGKGWLMLIAESLGRSANKMAKDLKLQGDALGKNATAKQNIEFQAKSQEFSQFFTGANTVIKTLGEALSAGARKQ